MTDEELAAIERTWCALPSAWIAEVDPGTGDQVYYDTIIVEDANALNICNAPVAAAIAKAPEHVAKLLAEVKRIRDADPGER